MKGVLFIFFAVFHVFAQAQPVDLAPDTLIDDSIVLRYDSLPEFSYFDATNIENHTNKITTYIGDKGIEKWYFIFMFFLSSMLTIYLLGFKSKIKHTLKSLVDINYSTQYLRTQKNNNLYVYLIFTFFFVIMLSVYLYFVLQQQSFLYVLIFVVGFTIYDILSNTIYSLFTNQDKSSEIFNSFLSFYILLVIILWGALFFLPIDLLNVKKVSVILFISILSIILLLRQIRILRVLNIEKVKIFNLQFFIYLCTFKIAPYIVIVTLLFC